MSVFISDLDDVLVDMCSGLIHAFNDKFGLYVPQEKWTHFDFRQYESLTKEQILSVHFEYNLIDSLDVFKGAREFLYTLKENDIDVVIMTSRSWHDRAKEKTINFLKEQDLPVSDVIVSDYNNSKGALIAEIGKNNDLIGFVDDNMKNAESAVGIVDNIYLNDKPWNKTLNKKEIKRVYSLSEILKDLNFK